MQYRTFQFLKMKNARPKNTTRLQNRNGSPLATQQKTSADTQNVSDDFGRRKPSTEGEDSAAESKLDGRYSWMRSA